MSATAEQGGTIRLDARDNVVVARRDLVAGASLSEEGLVLPAPVQAGHKIAARAIAAGEPVFKHGQVIGLASGPIAAGEPVTSGHLSPAQDAVATADAPARLHPVAHPAQFRGYVRADGRVGTRNTLGVFVVGNCGATAARQVSDWFDEDRLAAYPNVDAVVPYVHEIGCGMEMTGEPMDLLRRTLSGTIRNPNVAGAVVVALGCERNNLKGFLEQEGLEAGKLLRTVTIQEVGGIRNAVDAARAMIEEMLPLADAARRETVPVSRLTLGIQSGAPDGFSGLSANPALGVAVDLLVAQGATVILSETPELMGAGSLLAARAATAEIEQQLRDRFRWWHDYNAGKDTALGSGRLNPKSVAGGLSSTVELALDGLQRGGTTPLRAVHRYADRVSGPGLVFMDTPDYEPVAATGQIAGGATLIALTTGLGSSFGTQPAPTVKLSASTAVFTRMADDIDIDCGPVIDGGVTVEAMGRQVFDQLLRHASGEPTRAEVEGMGENEFVPWPIGVLA